VAADIGGVDHFLWFAVLRPPEDLEDTDSRWY